MLIHGQRLSSFSLPLPPWLLFFPRLFFLVVSFLSLLRGLMVVLLPCGAVSDTVHASIRRSSIHRLLFQYVQRPVEWSVPLGPRQSLRRRVAFGRNPVLISLQKAQGSFTNMTNVCSRIDQKLKFPAVS